MIEKYSSVLTQILRYEHTITNCIGKSDYSLDLNIEVYCFYKNLFMPCRFLLSCFQAIASVGWKVHWLTKILS